MSDPETEHDENRRKKRSSVIIHAAVRHPTGGTFERRIRNLSDTGACIDHDGEFAVGEELLLDMGTLSDVPAKVVWVKEKLAGITFSKPVDLAAARKPRGTAVTVKAGWLADLREMHR